jgi:hypothetical protein
MAGNVYKRNIVARSHNHCCSRNTTMHSVCVIEIHVTVNCIKYWVLYSNAFTENLCCRQKYKNACLHVER